MTDSEKDKLKVEDPQGFLSLKSKTINLGLDLQGGMHVILEVDIKELLDKLAKYKNEDFKKALDETAEEVSKTTDTDFITVFEQKLKARNLKIERFYANSDRRTEDDVVKFLREQMTEAVTRSLEILRNRVDEFGVSEPIIQKQGDRRIIVELAGITDPNRVRKLIGETALLEFKLLKDNIVAGQVAESINKFIVSKISPTDISEADKNKSKDTSATSLEEMFDVKDADSSKKVVSAVNDSVANIYEEGLFFLDPRDKQTILVPIDKKEKFKRILELPEVKKIIADDAGNAEFLWSAKPVFEDKYYQVYLVAKTVELTGETIVDAFPQPGSQSDPSAIGKYEISLTLSDDGARVFSRVTGANIGKRLAIILDNKVFLAPSLRVKISDGRARITGLDAMSEAKDLAIVLKAGALPAPVVILGEQTVGPSLGVDSIKAGSYSAIVGLLLVVLFMMLYYKLSGLVADLALVLNIVFIMAIMAYFHATLTLPGIAGIILTMGMAVDANVLIYERVREEIRRGKTVRASIDVGYGKAFITILDANVTTFIAGLVLYTYGSGPVQGFALTLMIGIVASMFTAIVVSRVIFDYSLSKFSINRLSI
jgi:preprotein translocase subunit SecD